MLKSVCLNLRKVKAQRVTIVAFRRLECTIEVATVLDVLKPR